MLVFKGCEVDYTKAQIRIKKIFQAEKFICYVIVGNLKFERLCRFK